MTQLAQNETFLSAALAWLRQGLSALCNSAKASSPTLEQTPFPDWRGTPLERIELLFGLSPFETKTLLLCAATELDADIAQLCAAANRDAHKPYPSVALALSLFEDRSWDVVSPERPLRYWRLLEFDSSIHGRLRSSERITNYVKGLNHIDAQLLAICHPMARPAEGTLAESQQQLARDISERLERESSAAPPLPIVQLQGRETASKRAIAAHVASQFGRELFLLHADALPNPAAETEDLAKRWTCETLLSNTALYLDAHGLSEAEAATQPVKRFLEAAGGLIFLSVAEPWSQLRRTWFMERTARPHPAERYEIWQKYAPALDLATARQLAAHFHMDAADITRIARLEPDERQAWRECRRIAEPSLDALAKHVVARATFADLVLPEEQTQQLHQIAAQVRHRAAVYEDWGFGGKSSGGLGISVLFAGESGTGKTMAAEVLADDLALGLYKIDLSGVVSKYIGETEKNLRKLFDAAEDGGAILFFDEADALFGKRSEVRDSHDRYANVEVNYLLQRMEAFTGLAILATNQKSALDTAFIRRLRFIVNFPFPARQERERMWRLAFPRQTPVQGLDYERLSRLSLTGGTIRNAALHAAFLAASEGTTVHMVHVLAAARAELQKLDRPLTGLETNAALHTPHVQPEEEHLSWR